MNAARPPFPPVPPVPPETLATRLRSGPLSVREATHIYRTLLSAIETATARGIALGPITPETIVLEDGRPILPSAHAPLTASPASALYAIAALFYESLSGRTWSAGADPAAADWSGIPRRLQRALRRALSPSPERRWPTAAAFQRALWVPRRRHQIWPAVLVILFAAAIIAAVALCKPLGLCWERQPAESAPSQTR